MRTVDGRNESWRWEICILKRPYFRAAHVPARWDSWKLLIGQECQGLSLERRLQAGMGSSFFSSKTIPLINSRLNWLCVRPPGLMLRATACHWRGPNLSHQPKAVSRRICSPSGYQNLPIETGDSYDCSLELMSSFLMKIRIVSHGFKF